MHQPPSPKAPTALPPATSALREKPFHACPALEGLWVTSPPSRLARAPAKSDARTQATAAATPTPRKSQCRRDHRRSARHGATFQMTQARAPLIGKNHRKRNGEATILRTRPPSGVPKPFFRTKRYRRPARPPRRSVECADYRQGPHILRRGRLPQTTRKPSPRSARRTLTTALTVT